MPTISWADWQKLHDEDVPDREERLAMHPQSPHYAGPKPQAPALETTRVVEPSGRGRKRLAVNELGQNKTEALFHADAIEEQREGLIDVVMWEPFKLKLANWKSTLRPDFLLQREGGRPVLVDVKGHMRDDAAVKLKEAAWKFARVFRLAIVSRGKRVWTVRAVSPLDGICRPVVLGRLGDLFDHV